MPRQTVNESTDANTFNKAAAPQVVQAAVPEAIEQMAVPTTDLLKRCAEIYEWRCTGVLSGEALRDYAKRKWPDRHDTLQMAEHETVTEALALLAKWGQSAQAAEPVAWLGNTTDPQPHAVTNLKYRSALQ